MFTRARLKLSTFARRCLVSSVSHWEGWCEGVLRLDSSNKTIPADGYLGSRNDEGRSEM